MLLVVGGQARKVGKTALAAEIISRFRQYGWTAVKISAHEHGDLDSPYTLKEQTEPGENDSGRYLRAGARRSFWLQVQPGRLPAALPALRETLAAAPHAIVESNSILEYLDPDLYLLVVDFGRTDFKSSALRYVERADALVAITRGLPAPLWDGVPRTLWEGKTLFAAEPPGYVTEGLSTLLAARLSALT